MSIWDAAGAAIAAAFADPEPIIYFQDGLAVPDVPVIRSDEPAPSFDGAGRTLRTITYEIQQADLPTRPVNGEFLFHRRRRWKVIDVTTLDDVRAWHLVVVDAGAAA